MESFVEPWKIQAIANSNSQSWAYQFPESSAQQSAALHSHCHRCLGRSKSLWLSSLLWASLAQIEIQISLFVDLRTNVGCCRIRTSWSGVRRACRASAAAVNGTWRLCNTCTSLQMNSVRRRYSLPTFAAQKASSDQYLDGLPAAMVACNLCWQIMWTESVACADVNILEGQRHTYIQWC